MTSADWKKIQILIRSKLLDASNEETWELPQEEHCGGFLAMISSEGEIISEVSHLEEKLVDLSETMSKLYEKTKEQKLTEEQIRKSNIHLCLIRDAIYIQNPLEWDMDKDGVCFQWGNRYRSYFMPYEVALIGGDKIRIMDRLCCHKCKPGVISSLWRLPCGLVFRLPLVWYK